MVLQLVRLQLSHGLVGRSGAHAASGGMRMTSGYELLAEDECMLRIYRAGMHGVAGLLQPGAGARGCWKTQRVLEREVIDASEHQNRANNNSGLIFDEEHFPGSGEWAGAGMDSQEDASLRRPSGASLQNRLPDVRAPHFSLPGPVEAPNERGLLKSKMHCTTIRLADHLAVRHRRALPVLPSSSRGVPFPEDPGGCLASAGSSFRRQARRQAPTGGVRA